MHKGVLRLPPPAGPRGPNRTRSGIPGPRHIKTPVSRVAMTHVCRNLRCIHAGAPELRPVWREQVPRCKAGPGTQGLCEAAAEATSAPTRSSVQCFFYGVRCYTCTQVWPGRAVISFRFRKQSGPSSRGAVARQPEGPSFARDPNENQCECVYISWRPKPETARVGRAA